jgi:hypothetical protein
MRAHVLGCMAVVITATAFAIAGPTQGATDISAFKPAIPDGCPQGPAASADRFRSWELAPTDDTRSRVAERDRLQQGSHRIKIVGGLWPSTNVAAQAGALEPTQAAVVVSGGIGVRESMALVESRSFARLRNDPFDLSPRCYDSR